MICEMCGKEVTFCRKVTIEGVQLEVCSECSKFGVEAKKAPPKDLPPKPLITQRLEVREKRGKPRDIYEGTGKEELAEDYPKKIRDARARTGMTQKELAMKINERVTVLSKIESGQMRPDDKMVAKLQKELGIVLKERVAEVSVTKDEHKSTSVTLADLITMKKD